MFNNLSYKANTNQNNTEILPHPSQKGYHSENKQQMPGKMGKGGVGKESLHTLGWNVN
jgi:hypothetical protein